jgi:2,3-bisphosphoglycerate-dependent phosphoglycerate mutase
MSRFYTLLLVIFITSCKTTTYFIVRHAEKETNTMSSDVPLSEAGKKRAEALKEMLKNEHISHIYSTNFIRTKSTAQPLADEEHLAIETYNPGDTAFITRLMNGKGNVLIIGHSNTVDDITNILMHQMVIPGDLPDSQYGDLFIVKKKGKKVKFEKKHFGVN